MLKKVTHKIVSAKPVKVGDTLQAYGKTWTVTECVLNPYATIYAWDLYLEEVK